MRREVRERILALDAALGEEVSAVAADRDRSPRGGANEQPADVGMGAKRGDQVRMALVDLLERQPAALLHQIDEAEVARAEHDDVAVGDVVLRPLRLLPGRVG